MSIGINLCDDFSYNDYELAKEELIRQINNLSIKDRRWIIMEIERTSLNYHTKILKKKK